MANKKKKSQKRQKEEPPEDLPTELISYWYCRYLLFSKYDEGIYLNNAMWYSVTPEDIARVIADQTFHRYPSATTILDAFGGAAGNSIQFAHYFPKVLYTDIMTENMVLAKNNAAVYNVYTYSKPTTITNNNGEEENDDEENYYQDAEDSWYYEHEETFSKLPVTELPEEQRNLVKLSNAQQYVRNLGIEFYAVDFFDFKYPDSPLQDLSEIQQKQQQQSSSLSSSSSLLSQIPQQKEQERREFKRTDVVFLSPPWGGPQYTDSQVWSLSKCKPYSIQEIVEHTRKHWTDNIVLYLPRNSDFDEINDLVEENDDDVPVFYLSSNGREKAMIVFLGPDRVPMPYN